MTVEELMADLIKAPSYWDVFIECCCGMCSRAGDVVSADDFLIITREEMG